MRRRLLPGAPAVWRTAAVVAGVLGVVLLGYLLRGQEHVLGTNSVFPRIDIVEALPGQQVCARNVVVPDGTGRYRLNLDSRDQPQPALEGRLRLLDPSGRRRTGEVLRGASAAPSGTTGRVDRDLVLGREVDAPNGRWVRADVCFRPTAGAPVYAWGVQGLAVGEKPLLVGGNLERPGRISLTFLPREDEQRSLLSALPEVFSRADLFRPGWVQPWVLALLLFGGTLGLGYAALRTLATAENRRPARLALRVGLIGFAIAACWAVLTPMFQAPDESEHFAAVQYLAETGKAVDPAPIPSRPVPWSLQVALGVDGTKELTTFERQNAKLPFDRVEEEAWKARQRRSFPDVDDPKADGGGYHPAVSSHTPLYYAAMAPAYYAGTGGSLWDAVQAVRWENALLGGLTAAFAVLTVLVLLPAAPLFAAAAGLLVAFTPTFGFISGAVNNDNGVNAAAALVILLTVLALRRGLTPAVGAGLGVALALAPLWKGTGYILFPVVALAVVAMLWMGRRRRATWIGAALLVAGVLATNLVWGEIAASFERSLFATPGGNDPTTSTAITARPREFLSYLWQVLIPVRPPFLEDFTLVKWPLYDIYVREGFAAFGWYAIFFDEWVYVVVLAASLALAALGLVTLWRRRRELGRRWVEAAFLVAVPVAVVVAVTAAYTPGVESIPTDGTAEQGRYGFTAIAAVAALAAAACASAPRRWRVPLATGLVTALVVMTLAGQLLMYQSFYF